MEVTSMTVKRIQLIAPRDNQQQGGILKHYRWIFFLALFVVMAGAEFYVLTASDGHSKQSPLVQSSLVHIQETLRTSSTSPAFTLSAIMVAFFLGGLHALSPGHNKVLTGAFLVSARGKIRHAILIGGATAFSHTASVIVIGLLALSSPGQAAVTFYLRWLGVPSGLL